LGDAPVTIENDAYVRAPLAVRPFYGVGSCIHYLAMMLRRAVGELDGGRYVEQLCRVPCVGDAGGGERDERVQTVARRASRRRVFDERDPAFYLVEFGSPVAHECRRDRAQPAGRVVDELTPRPHATSFTLAPDLASCDRSASAGPPPM